MTFGDALPWILFSVCLLFCVVIFVLYLWLKHMNKKIELMSKEEFNEKLEFFSYKMALKLMDSRVFNELIFESQASIYVIALILLVTLLFIIFTT